jgi:ketosteroid isomerase-like protein
MTVAAAFERLFHAACEARDIDAFMDVWLVDEPSITMWGSDLDERAVGHDAIRALGEELVALDVQLSFEWDEVQIHERGDSAWVNASGWIDVGDTRSPYRLTAVFERNYAGWRWHTFNGSIPDA